MSRTAGSGFQTTGTTRASLNISVIRAMPVPVPPLDEQRRIVDLLEDHLSRLDAADAYLHAAQRRNAVLHDQLLGSELAAVESADVPLAELLTMGLSNGKSVPTQEGGFPVLRLTALRDGRIDLAERKPGAWTADDASRFLVERGDFLIARGNGSLRLVGRGGLVTDEPDAVAFPDTLIRARPDLTRVHPEFLAQVWNAHGVRRQIKRSARTTAGIYKVNQKDLAEVRVPVPNLADQVRITAAVRESRDVLSQLFLEVDRAIARSSALRRSLLAAVFSGRLTGNAADLSPAEEMINA
jgi:type I restriction enzyme S subunit